MDDTKIYRICFLVQPVIAFDHRELRGGVPQRLSALRFKLDPRDLGSADYVLSPRLAVVRKNETALVPWVTLGRFERAIDDVREAYPVVIVVLERREGALPEELRRGVLARLPGVSHVGARRLLEHFGSVRALAAASAEEIQAVRGFGPKRAADVEAALAHRRDPHALAA